MKKTLIFLLLIFLSGLLIQSSAQQKQNFNRSTRSTQKAPVTIAFSEIEQGIASGNVAVLSKYLSPHTYFSLSNGVSGYYSSNQAYYILEDFFSIYKVTSFKLNNIREGESTPYATGVYGFESKGKKDTSQVYISLKNVGGGWKITQISIN